MGVLFHSFKMASGISVASEVVDTFNDIKLSHKHRYSIYKRNADNTEIVLESFADPSKTYDDFCAALPPNECRYGIFDLEYSKSEADGMRQKIIFVVWAPDSARIKEQLVGISTEMQATDAGELDYNLLIDKVNSIS